MTVTRPSMDDVLMRVTHAMSTRGTCSRHHVGAVIALDGRVISSGFNGPPSGMPHCQHDLASGKPYVNVDDGCVNAVHAEANAIAFAARHGVSTQGGTLYTTLTPCLACAMLIINAGIKRVVWCDIYRKKSGLKLLTDAGITVSRNMI